MDVLVVIDMQNDFINGVFGTKEAQEIVPKVADFIKNFKGKIYLTQDYHYKEDNIEEKTLPKHCWENTDGYEFPKELILSEEQKESGCIYHKHTFGCPSLAKDLRNEQQIYICGLCTDICVISNVLMIRAFNPYAKITVLSDLCAATTPENHNKALDIMKMNLIDVKESNEVLNK